MLKLPEPGTLYLNSKSFKRMKRLGILIFSNVIPSGTTESIPHMLRLFEFPGYQFSTFPFNSVPKQLVILSLPYSHIQQSGQGFKLVILDLQDCIELRISPRNLVSTSFRILNFGGCSRLQNFPNIIIGGMTYLRSVDITGTAIKEFPFTVELLVGLRETQSGGLSSHEKLMLIPTNELLDNPRFQTRTMYDRFGHGGLNSFDTVLGNSNLSSEDFLLTPGSFNKLYWLDRSKNKFVRLPSFGHREGVEVVMHISGINHKLIANLPTQMVDLDSMQDDGKDYFQ
ncbi:hypothetical protein FEM48_Zijuj05G0175200 [Ziziphus jujuba var. spinosa]|uniref:Uncharacterized protein n=1 Tax=Ziziphus jujuba var. spinosa TaxID=714518 RepID=A0A978VG63_ZIZJJ|nr:hypothetical protein FEM48_Zijuj05G0175200 [Ziziphus jujuba var. spinosa]